jgi:hypothetical protein
MKNKIKVKSTFFKKPESKEIKEFSDLFRFDNIYHTVQSIFRLGLVVLAIKAAYTMTITFYQFYK